MADVFNLVRQHAERNRSAVAILSPEHAPLTYGGLCRQIEDVVATLNALGVGRNDRVAIVLPDGPELAVALVAIGAGATCAPLNPVYRDGEFEFALADIRAAALVVQSGSESAAVDVARGRGIPVLELSAAPGGEAGLFALSGTKRPRPTRGGFAEPDDNLLMLHTSGTAARPKLVPLTHRNVVTSAHDIGAALGLTARDRCLNVMPLIHIHGQSTVWSSLVAGASVVCTPGFSAADFFDWLREFHPTWYTAAPAIHRLILAEALRRPDVAAHSTLRFIRSASSAMPRELIADMERALRCPVHRGVRDDRGRAADREQQTAALRPQARLRRRAAGPDIAIMDEAGDLLPPGESGEVVIRGANVMSGYDRDQRGDGTAFTRGWFRTGDTGHLDVDGDLFITGRLKEIINRGGEKISPQEVDDVLMAHPAVAEAVAFPVPHATLGESVAAAVVLREGARATEQEILQFAASRLAPFKLPQPIVIADAIPKGRHGQAAADRSRRTTGPGGSRAPPRPEQERIRAAAHVDRGEDLRDSGRRARPRADRHPRQLLPSRRTLTDRDDGGRPDRGGVPGRPARCRALFERPTVAALAETVAMRLPGRSLPGRFPARRTADPCPLSFAQQRLWFLDQVEPGNPAYNMQAALHLTGALDLAALEESLSEIRRRHEALRTTFTAVDGQALQVIDPATPLRLPVVDLSRVPPAARLGEARRAGSRAGRASRSTWPGAALSRRARPPGRRASTCSSSRCTTSSPTAGRTRCSMRSSARSTGRSRPAGRRRCRSCPSSTPTSPLWQRRWVEETRELEAQLDYWKEQLRDAPPALDLALRSAPAGAPGPIGARGTRC